MTTTRISAAELFSKPHEFSSQEEAAFAQLTDDEITRGALSDADAQPSTSEMLARGRHNRRSRQVLWAMRVASLGARLWKAAADLDLPVFEVTDERGRTILLKAKSCRKIAPSHDPAAQVLKLEAIVAAEGPSLRDDHAEARARSPESQTS